MGDYLLCISLGLESSVYVYLLCAANIPDELAIVMKDSDGYECGNCATSRLIAIITCTLHQ